MTAVAYGRPRSTTRAPALWRVYRVEMVKLLAQWRTRLALLACLLAPVAFALIVGNQQSLPTDSLFGRWLHESGYAAPLVVLGFSGLWVLPVVVGIVAGDMFAVEDRLGTWRMLLVGARSVRLVFAAKASAAASYAVAVVITLGVSSTAAGVLVGGSRPLVGLSGQLVSSPVAVRLIAISWISALAPALAFAAFGLLFSVAFRYSPAAVAAPILLALVLQLVALAPLPAVVRVLLPTTPFTTWRGLFAVPGFHAPLVWGLAVSGGWAVVGTAGAYLLLTRREFSTGGRFRAAAGQVGILGGAFGLVAVALVAVAVLTGGPAASGITQPKLEATLATTFAHLYRLQQRQLGHPDTSLATIAATASCEKGGPATANVGPGTGWRCVVSWHVAGAQTPAQALYQLEVAADGRYVADGDGPRTVNGYTTVTTPRGTRVNPLWQFDSVVDLGSPADPKS